MTAPSSLELTDQEFLAAFHRGELDRYVFPHEAHLRLGWLLVRKLGLERAMTHVTSGVRALAEKHGSSRVYHDTMTRAWIYLIADAAAQDPDMATFDTFLQGHPELLNKAHLLQYYSPSTLAGFEARNGWIAPDIQRIPGAPTTSAKELSDRSSPTGLPITKFLEVLDGLTLPVAVMAAHDSIHVRGTTVTSVGAVARDPAMLVASLRPDSRLLPVIRAAGGFSISYLGEDQMPVAVRFAERSRNDDTAQFHGVPHTLGPFGAPIISGGAAWFECQGTREFNVDGHQLVCGTVVAAGANDVQSLKRFTKEAL